LFNIKRSCIIYKVSNLPVYNILNYCSKDFIEEQCTFNSLSGHFTKDLSRNGIKVMKKASRLSQELFNNKRELTRSNIDYGFKSGNNAEVIIRGNDGQRQSINLQAVQYLVDIDFRVFEVLLVRHNTKIEVKRVKHEAWINELRGKLLELQNVEIAIKGHDLTMEDSTLQIEMFTAAVDYAVAQQELKHTELDKFIIEAERERNKLLKFKAEIDQFASLLNLNISKFNLYKAEISLEVSKVDKYDIEVRTAESKLRAQTVVTRSNEIIGRSRLTVANANLDVQAEKLRAARIRLDNSLTGARATAQAFNTKLIKYRARLLQWLNDCRDITLEEMLHEKAIRDNQVTEAESLSDVAQRQEEVKIEVQSIKDLSTLNIEVLTALAEIQSKSEISSQLIHSLAGTP